jgi:hypothetical protein
MRNCSVCGKPTSDAPYRDHYQYFHLKLEEVFGRDSRTYYFCSGTCLIIKTLEVYKVNKNKIRAILTE